MKKGQRLTTAERDTVERVFRQNPGLKPAEYIPLLKEGLGSSVVIASVYRWMKQHDVPTPTRSKGSTPVASPDEREALRRLMEHMEVPDLSQISARWKLARGGVSVVEKRGGGSLRLVSEDGAHVSGCWLSASEREFFERILARADSIKGTDLAPSFRDIHSQASTALDESLQLERSMASQGEWRTFGSPDQTPRQRQASALGSALLDLRARLEEFTGEARLVTGA